MGKRKAKSLNMSKILDVSKIGVANKEYSTGIKKFNLASEVDRYFRGTSKRFFPDEDKKVTRDRINKLLNSKSKRKKLLEDHIKEITPSSFASKVKFDDFKLDVGRLLTYYVVIEPNQDEVKSIIELRKNDAIYLKASRSMHFEKIIEKL